MKHLRYLWVGVKEAWIGFAIVGWFAITCALAIIESDWPFYVWIAAWVIGFLVALLYWLGREISEYGY